MVSLIFASPTFLALSLPLTYNPTCSHQFMNRVMRFFHRDFLYAFLKPGYPRYGIITTSPTFLALNHHLYITIICSNKLNVLKLCHFIYHNIRNHVLDFFCHLLISNSCQMSLYKWGSNFDN